MKYFCDCDEERALSEAKDQFFKFEPGQVINSRNLLPSEYWYVLPDMSRYESDEIISRFAENGQLPLLCIGKDNAGFRQYMVV